MAEAGADLGSAWLNVVPSFNGMKREIAKELGGVDVTGSTSSWSSRLGESLTRGIGGALETIGKIGLGAATAAVGGLGAALGAYIPEAIKASDATDKFQNTLKFAGVEPGKIKELTASAQKYADRTIFDLQDIQSVTSKLAANSVKGFDKLAEAAGNLTIAAGSGKVEFAQLGYALVQINAAGKLMTQDWNQVANAIPGGAGKIMAALKDIGAYTGDFRDAMSKGQISAEEFNQALLNLGFDEAAVEAAQSADLFETAWGNLEASLNTQLTGALREVKKPTTELINALADGLVPQLGEKLAPAAQSAAGWIQRLADSVKSGETNIKSLKGQLEAVTGGFGAMLAAGAGLKNFQQIAGFFGGIDGALGKTSGSLGDFAKGIPDAAKSLGSLKTLPGEVTGAFGQMSKRVAAARFEMTGVADGFFGTLFGGTRLGSALSSANGQISAGMGVLKNTMIRGAATTGLAFDTVAARMAPAVSRIGGVASSIGGKIVGPLAPIGARVRAAFGPLGAAFDGVGSKLSGLGSKLSDLAPKASQSLGKLGSIFAPGRMLKVLAFGGLAAAAFAGIGAIVQQGGVELVGQISKTLQGLPGQIALYGEKIAQALPEALATGTSIVTMVVNAITQSMPQLSNAIGKVVPALVKGLSDALPVLLPAVAQMITAIATALVENAPMLVESSLQLMQGLVDGIFAALPVLISAMPTLIQTFMDGLLQGLPRLLEMGTKLLQSIIDGISQTLPTLTAALPQIIQTFMDGLLQALPQILAAGTQLLQSIIDGILQAMPTLIAMLPQIITTIITGLVQALPMIIQAGVGILNALINGLIQAIPMLIEALPTIITTVVDTLLANLPMIIEAGIQLLIGVITGIVQAIPQLIAMLPQIIVTIVTTLVQNIPRIITAGIQILVGLVTGIVQAIPQIGSAIAQVGSSIMSAVAGFPRMLFESGKKIIGGLIDGVKSMFSSAKNAVSGLLSGIRNLLPFSPAKEGPFSGKGWTLYSGMSIAEALADGMHRRGHLFKEAVAETMAAGQAQIRDLEAGQVHALGAYSRASMMSDWTLGKTQSARELVVRDVNDQLVGRMRVEAYGVTGDALGSVSRGSLRERIGISR